jgi:putative SbcD/Mre11-related phosphoesterase
MNQLEVMPGLLITNQLCAIIKDEGTVVVSDLHVGYESVLEDSGLHLPRIQTEAMRDSLLDIIDRFSPERFLLLGDLKHEFSRNLAQEWSEARRILGTLQDHGEVIIVRGNHDNYLAAIASKLGVRMVEEHVAAGIYFAHGHLPNHNRPLVMGHEHPSVRLFDSVGAYVKLPCFVHFELERILIMPAFSPLAAGTDITSGAQTFSPILEGADLGQAKVYGCSEIGVLNLGEVGKLSRSRR